MNSPTEQARSLLQQGRIADAEAAFARVLDSTPDNVEALNVVALGVLRDGDIDRAIGLLDRAVQIDSTQALSHFHLARACEAGFDLARAADSYSNALAQQPKLHPARLHLAALLEKQGDSARALVQYVRALQDAQADGRWLNASTTPPRLRPMVEHALEFTRAYRKAAFDTLLAPLVTKYGTASLQRVEQALRIHLNQEAPPYTDPRQRPTFLFFPGLPATPYLPRSMFPAADILEQHSDAIRQELLALLPSAQGRERVFDNEALEQQNLRGSREPPSWNGYYFFRHGERREDNCRACPVTAAALDRQPLARVRGHAPEALFSVFTPGTHLLPHRGVTNTRVVGHLPLLVPSDCALKVGGEEHVWQEGKVVVFDDTYEHEAWNRSSQTRVVLIFDLWNPYLTEVEVAALADIVSEIGEFRGMVEAL
jgi:aspartate beta-hydroxylase